MPTQLNKHTYQKLIDQDIKELEKYMPNNSLEKNHIIDILKWSVNEIYNKQHSYIEPLVLDQYLINNIKLKHKSGQKLSIDEWDILIANIKNEQYKNILKKYKID
jgi:hypothetical protein